RLDRVAGVKGEVAARGLVIVVGRGRRAVSGGEVDSHRQAAGERDTDGEDRVGRATIALYLAHIVDAERGVVVEALPLGSADGDLGVACAGEIDKARPVGLPLGVHVALAGYRLAGLAGVKGKVAAGGLVVVVGRGRRAIGGGEVDAHRLHR